jgi:predicted lipoprotein with Yx(FWY)xxD motif
MNRIRLPLAIVVVIVAAAVAVIVATSSGNTKKAQPSVTANSGISLKQTSVGKGLADANGRTLYLFAGDKRGLSTLSAAGRAVWPPFTSTTLPQAGGGVAVSQIATVASTSGGTQISYKGHPLYYYVGDHKPGQILGQGLNEFGGRWHVVSATGAAITSAPKSAPNTSTGSGYSSSYSY